jgi:hypothetical protein
VCFLLFFKDLCLVEPVIATPYSTEKNCIAVSFHGKNWEGEGLRNTYSMMFTLEDGSTNDLSLCSSFCCKRNRRVNVKQIPSSFSVTNSCLHMWR